MSQLPPTQEPKAEPPSQTAPLRMSDQEIRSTNRIIVFGILFGVTGALGLPLLWFSKHFTSGEKIAWSFLVSLYTVSLIAGTLGICWWALNQIFPEGVWNNAG